MQLYIIHYAVLCVCFISHRFAAFGVVLQCRNKVKNKENPMNE